ncbi:hypothetical protein GCM10017714_09730 [Curtobacterium pusillum]|uniref:Uncharacterized protein n=1 Tax=Curtobacterium pusillum TaxID=69373 RepID=A0ABX2MBS6_9MICO|nr:hypothetical protein [Curtobacterium pusillum]NUU12769.1 hypothetical protein [Curtobacterium pusillum]GLK30235.1 hypothetical protein GCM10017610_05200 [Curtobacterium pusillum]
MSAEWVVLSDQHVDAAAVLAGAAEVDPAIGIRQVWDGDAVQLVDQGGVVLLTLFQSRRLDSPVDAERLLGRPLPGDGDRLWWTEVHAAAQPPFRVTATRIVQNIADAAGGTAASRAAAGH